MIFKVLLLAGVYSSLSSLPLLAAARGVLSPIRSTETPSPAGTASPFPMLETPSPLAVKTQLLEEAAKAEDEHASVHDAKIKEITAHIERLATEIAAYQHQLDEIRAEIQGVQLELNVTTSHRLTRRAIKLSQTLQEYFLQKASLEENIYTLQKTATLTSIVKKSELQRRVGRAQKQNASNL